MANHKEILWLKSLGLTHREIVDAAGCGRNTVTRTLARAREQKLDWQQAQSMSQQGVSQRLFPTEQKDPVYKMPDYEWVHREMQKNGVTLSLLWVEYCEQCHQNGELPYKSTQFNKYYADYVHKTKATIEKQSSRSMTTDMFIGLVRKYTRARKLTPRMLNELVEKIEVFNAEKIDGVWEQRLRIHYNCVGTIEIPTVLPLPIPEVSVNTRKGVVVNYAPCELAV